MVLYLMLALAAIFAFRALVGWRQGLMLMVLLAAVQDPLRKMVPGTPGWLVLITMPVFLAAVLVSMSRTRRWWGEFRQHFPAVAGSLLLLPALALPAAYLSASYSEGSWKLTLLGAFSYSIIFLAMVAGYHFARHLGELRRLLVIYCLVNTVMLSGAFIEYLQLAPEWAVIGSKALGFEWVRWGSGYTVDMIAGFYRSADVMGWHAAAVCMLSLLLAMTGKKRRSRVWLAVTVFALVALLLCGRRKMVYMLPVFLVTLAWMFWQAGRRSRMIALLGLLLIPVTSVWIVGDVIGEGSANIRYYSGEGLNSSAFESIQGQGFGNVAETYRQNGFFGQGLGFATPGSHNLKVERPRAWQEGAPSRIVAELGVPGAIGFLAVMFSIGLSLWRLTMRQLRERSLRGQYAAGLVAFFLANVGSLTVSGQILADPFIATFLGVLVGLAMSTPRLGEMKAPERRKTDQRPAVHDVPGMQPR
jgi:O-antigen ligase